MNQKKNNIPFTIKVCFTHSHTRTHTCTHIHTQLELKVHFDVCRLPHLGMTYNISITPDNFLVPLSVFASHSIARQDHAVDLLSDIVIVCCLFLLQTGNPLCTCSRLSCRFRARSSMGRVFTFVTFAVVKMGYSWSFRRSDRDTRKGQRPCGGSGAVSAVCFFGL